MDFCARCSRLDIALPSFISHPGTDANPRLDSPIYNLGTLEDLKEQFNRCFLCRLAFRAFQFGPLKCVSLTELHRTTIFATWINALGPSKEQRLKSSSLCILLWPESPQIPPATYKVIIRPSSKVLPTQLHFSRSPHHTLLDYERMKLWLKQCERNHTSCISASKHTMPKPTKTFLVIDCTCNCIVRAPDHCRYLALSYVWGHAQQLLLTQWNFNILTRAGGLTGQPIPQIIRDSMLLTVRLGERYLWVDSLCILQDSDAIRQQSIEDMDRIYVHSLLSIIAGTSTNANDFLPGVTTLRVWKQICEHISPNLTLSAHFDYKDYLEGSIYSSRAWTFQEQQLATRLLIFASNGQVYFSCKEVVFSEEVVCEYEPGPDAAMLEGANLVKIRPDPINFWTTYRRAVESFTARRMTHEGDILNAFSGILRMICPERKLEGIPIPVFDLALLWQPRERLRRRMGFSSWSWAGWVGQVHWYEDRSIEYFHQFYDTEQDQVNAWMKTRNWIVWYSSWGSNTKSRTYIMEGPPWLCGATAREAEHQERFAGQPRNFLPTTSLLPRRLDRLENQRQHIRYLQFWTLSAYFDIKSLDKAAVIPYSSSGAEHTGDGLRVFVLRNKFQQDCGWVLLDEDWVERVNREGVRLQEFIMLSEGCHPMADQRPQNLQPYKANHLDDFKQFNAMMINWRGGIAERVGLGRVMKDALVHACGRDMKWKEILLG
ncbi:HET-domain-containing protein [Zopfia rhizophila CBS 207.26]|uniref:HET-domain-containing protein n=1 Tax=Zopfia rhizophila CBS 207.26 TaxID=1314779 RepID=A0A6A6E1T5_9PEZI|nr:HET-domain-containing protein [Zopfia rhizophila CBS 207.26]